MEKVIFTLREDTNKYLKFTKKGNGWRSGQFLDFREGFL